MNEATEGISHYYELLTAVANLLGLKQLPDFSLKLKREERSLRVLNKAANESVPLGHHSQGESKREVAATVVDSACCTRAIRMNLALTSIGAYALHSLKRQGERFIMKKFSEGLAMRACLRSEAAVALQSGRNVERLGQGGGGHSNLLYPPNHGTVTSGSKGVVIPDLGNGMSY